MLNAVLAALSMAFAMGWEILWALILGFALSGVVQAVVTKGEMSRLLPDSSPRSICIASGLGIASSSCSYAAVALARSIFRKGADFVAAMAFKSGDRTRNHFGRPHRVAVRRRRVRGWLHHDRAAHRNAAIRHDAAADRRGEATGRP